MLRPVALGPTLPQRSARSAPETSRGGGNPKVGLNFATLDYLGLSTHPAIRAAALTALDRERRDRSWRTDARTAGAEVLSLQARLAEFLQAPAVLTFGSGTEAIRRVLRGLFRPGDDVIVDAGAHDAIEESALVARATSHRCLSGSVEAVERRLSRLRRQGRKGRLYVAVSAISAHGSRMADLAGLSALARSYDASLIGDVSHDLGSMGQGGRGVMEIQGCIGRVDILLGSLGKSFGAPGGFAAFRDPDLAGLLQGDPSVPAYPSPVNAAALQAGLDLIDSAEGRRRRLRLHGCALRLRNHLMADGIRVMGQASPLVPVKLPVLTALPRTALLQSAGPVVTLLQAPVVAAHAPRWRVQLNSNHGAADIDDLAELIRDVTRAFDRQRPTNPQREDSPARALRPANP